MRSTGEMASFPETPSPKQFQTSHHESCGCWPKHWTVLVHIFDFNYASMLAFNRCSHVAIHCLGDRIWHGMPLSQAANVYERAADASSQQRKWIVTLFDFVVSILGGGFYDVFEISPPFGKTNLFWQMCFVLAWGRPVLLKTICWCQFGWCLFRIDP